MNIRKFKRSLLYPILVILMNNNKGEVSLMGGAGGSGGDGGASGGDTGGGGDGGSGDGGDGSGGGSGDDGGSGGGSDVVYPDGFDDGLKGNTTVLRYYDKESKEFSIPKLSKALVHANNMISSEKIAKPNSKWTDDQWRQHALDSGLPAHIDGYALENRGLPEGAKADDRFLDAFKQQAYASGLQPKQAEKLLEWYNGQQVEQGKTQQIMAKQQLDEGIADLTREYGNGLKGALQRGEHALKQFASQDEIKTMHESGMLDNPLFSRFLIQVADAFNEEVFDDTTNFDNGMTPAQAALKLEEMSKPDHPFNTTKDPKTKAMYREEWSSLAAIKAKGKKSGQSGRRSAMV